MTNELKGQLSNVMIATSADPPARCARARAAKPSALRTKSAPFFQPKPTADRDADRRRKSSSRSPGPSAASQTHRRIVRPLLALVPVLLDGLLPRFVRRFLCLGHLMSPQRIRAEILPILREPASV